MTQLDLLRKHLKKGKVYRRGDLKKWSNAVDRHLNTLLEEGTLQKLSQGIYYFPKESAFGRTPATEEELVESFLKDNRYLIISPNDYNTLGLGTTQLYNQRIVYNHKRHGDVKLGNRTFSFKVKHHFPTAVTQDFLLVDMVNNLDNLAEDKASVLEKLREKLPTMDLKNVKRSVVNYGSNKTKKIFEELISNKRLD